MQEGIKLMDGWMDGWMSEAYNLLNTSKFSE